MPLDPTQPRDAIIAAGRERLLRHGLDALRSQLNASVLSQEVPVSRDTAYRVFRGGGEHDSVSDAIIAAVSEAASDFGWGGYDMTFATVLEAYQTSLAAGNDPVSNWKAALRATFDAQFAAPGHPIGWMLQSAAMTCSDAWRGEAPSEEDLAIGRVVLANCRANYDAVAGQLLGFMTVALSDLGRRPKAGWAPRDIVAVIHALLDGAMLRRIIDPEAFSADLFADSMLELWLGVSEPGATVDPRKPDDERSQRVFDQLLGAAEVLWRDSDDVTVECAAKHAGVSADATTLLFPTVGDLVDSLVRARVVGGGFPDLGPVGDAATARQHLPGVAFALVRLRDFAESVPRALHASGRHSPTRSKPFVEDFVGHNGRIVAALDATTQPEQLVRDLFAFAAQGTAGWASVAALFRTVDYDAV